RQSALPRVERGQLVALITDDCHRVSFEPLASRREIENDFGARANDNDRSTCELRKVSGNVRQRATMNAADTAGREDFDSGTMSDPARGSDCCCAVPTLSDSD